MDGERWTSRWEPSSGHARPAGRGTDRGHNYNRNESYRLNSSIRHSSLADKEESWTKRSSALTGDSHIYGRPSSGFSSGFHAYRHEEKRQEQTRNQPQERRQHGTPGFGANWVQRGKQEGMYDFDTDLMGDAFGGLDPGECDARPSASVSAGGQEVDAWSDSYVPGGGSGSCAVTWVPTGLTLAQLEEAVLRGKTSSWSFERLAEAAAALCRMQSTGSPGQDACSETTPFNRREEIIMDAIATAVICKARSSAPLASVAAASSSSRIGWLVAQLLWSCARGQYWMGPPKQQSRTGKASTTSATSADAVVLPYGSDSIANTKGSGTWPSPAELRFHVPFTAAESRSAAVAAEEGMRPAFQAEALKHSNGEEEATRVSKGSASQEERDKEEFGVAEAADCSSMDSYSDGTSLGPWRPLAVEVLHWLAAHGCRLVDQLDSESLSLVWWALAKAAAAARAKHGGGRILHPAGATPPAATNAAAAAADVFAAISPALVASLDARAMEELKKKSNAKLCALLYSCACVNKSSDRLLCALGDELATRLESAMLLMEARIEGMPRGRFSPRELSCISYSCGLIGLRHERLLSTLSEFAASSSHMYWSASAISVFMYGIANVGHRDQRLMAWADAAISAKSAAEFNLRNISFLLYNFHRLRWWPRCAAEHLLAATQLHAAPTIPLISVSTILMCMGSARVRDELSLAHLCQALTRRPTWQLSCKDVCICLTALQRLHGEDVLASQQPEVLAALDHLVDAIVQRGFSRATASCRAVPVFNHQEVSNAIFALGKLKYYRPAVLDTLRDHAARGGLDGASAWDCTATLVGLAQLNYGAPDDSYRCPGWGSRIQAAAGPGAEGARNGGRRDAAACDVAGEVDMVWLLADAVARKAHSAKSQDLANTLWALTVMEGGLERYRPIVTALLEEVNRRGPASKNPDGFNLDEQRQLWQVHRELAALPRPCASLREDLVQLAKLGMSEADHTYSRVQASFQSLLSAMYTSGRYPRLRDLLFEQELVPGGDQLMRIDAQAIIERPCPEGGTTLHRVAVEFDGPFHYMVNEPYTARIDGRTALRNRILMRHLGKENLVCISMAEWVAASREPPINGLPGRWRLVASKMGL